MWKVLLFPLLILVSGSFGTILSLNLKQRRKDIDRFLFGLHIIESEMQYETAALPVCFQRAGDAVSGVIRDLFYDTAEQIKKSGNGEDAFLLSLEKHREELAFIEKDFDAMRRFANGLGEKDLEQALKDLDYLNGRMMESLDEAILNEKKWGRLFMQGGWLTGICAALVFI